MAGCNRHSNPVEIDDQGNLIRTAQDFEAGEEWETGYSLDSSTSIWLNPVSTSTAQHGDIALYDYDLEVSPLATAFVSHDNPEATSYIQLEIRDGGFNSVYSDDTIYASGVSSVIFCRHPAVEVTYKYDPVEDIGFLDVHIVWAQLTDVGITSNWDLYYTRIRFVVTDAGVLWGFGAASTPAYIFSTSDYDELQPDLSVSSAAGDIFLVFNRNLDENEDVIMVAMKPYSGSWSLPVQVSATDDTPKVGPRIDVDLINFTEQPSLEDSVAVVWSEDDPTDDWQVFFNTFLAYTETPTPGNTEQISEPGENDEVGTLPQIDITPNSCDINQAVVTWTMAAPDQGSFINHNVMIAATPFWSTESIYNSRYSRVPDVACYQYEDPDEAWFGLSYYWTDDEADELWEVWTRSYSFEVDWEFEQVLFTPEDECELPGEEGLWTSANPFTGSTLCLRIPEDDPVDDTEFGIAWIEDDYLAMLSEGSII